MTSRKLVSRAASAAIAVCAAASFAGAGDVPASNGKLGDLRAVGTVQLKSSCDAEAQAGIEHATALLHSFFYDEARRVFTKVATRDPKLRDGAVGHRHDRVASDLDAAQPRGDEGGPGGDREGEGPAARPRSSAG